MRQLAHAPRRSLSYRALDRRRRGSGQKTTAYHHGDTQACAVTDWDAMTTAKVSAGNHAGDDDPPTTKGGPGPAPTASDSAGRPADGARGPPTVGERLGEGGQGVVHLR
jgi:hypothetical protein